MNKADPIFMQHIIANKNGVCCTLCGQNAKVYDRTIHATTAAQLIRAYHLGAADEYIHVSKILFRGSSGIGDFPKAFYWGLIQEMPNDDPGKRTSGYWKLTSLGVEFILGKVGIPKYVRVYNGHLLHPPFHGKTVYISDCLGTKFDYQELMAS